MRNEPSHPANFDENDYARPNQSWNCGWAADGHACPLGPTRLGICRSAHECAPYQSGDTWVCARIKANGGPCEEGPLPDGNCCRPIQRCQPVRSILSSRGIVSLCVFAAAVGVALMMVAAPGRSRLISPGPLISAHRQSVDRCEDCHVAGDGDLSDWIHAAVAVDVGQQQSALCLKCHAELGPDPLKPHSQSADQLAALTDQLAEPSTERKSVRVTATQSLLGPPHEVHDGLACATCHREHHGAAALTALTNHQCQVCHSKTFHSFGNGHPDLDDYPHQRRTRIYFDHQTHYGEHFQDARGQAHSQCRSCHVADVAGRYMLVRSFEQTCADCHDHQIRDDLSPGLQFAALPAIDVDSLRAAGLDIGEWPMIYPRHVEAGTRLSPFHTMIAPRRTELQTLQSELSGVDLADLRQATPAQLKSTQALIWATKESLVDILELGRIGLQQDLATSLKGRMTTQQVERLLAAVPLEGFSTMQRQWLPNVVQEVAAHRAGNPLPAADASNSAAGGAEPQTPLELAPPSDQVADNDRHSSRLLNRNWTLHSPTLSLRYQPTGHADPLLKTMLESSLVATEDELPLAANTIDNQLATETVVEFYKSLASPFAQGRCTKCHTVDNDADTAAQLNWQTYKPPLAQHAFTYFNHAPHVALQSNSTCLHCHAMPKNDLQRDTILRPEFVNESGLPAISTADFQSDFAPMSKSNCTECHTKQLARDRCTTCHNYHVR